MAGRVRRRMDASEAAWLDALARFDIEERWRENGEHSGVDWLMTLARLARSSAFDKLRVALELRHRPVLTRRLRRAGSRTARRGR